MRGATCIVRGKVKSVRQKLLPLIQGGLETTVVHVVTVEWEDEKAMTDRVNNIGYPVGDEQFPD